MSLVALFEQVADQIREGVSNDVWDFQVEPWAITSPTPPSVDMYRGALEQQELANMGATLEDMREAIVLVVRARVSTNDYEANQDVLYALADPTDQHSLVQAIYDDPTLNGYATDVSLIGDSGFTIVSDFAGEVHYGNVWRFLVLPAWS